MSCTWNPSALLRDLGKTAAKFICRTQNVFLCTRAIVLFLARSFNGFTFMCVRFWRGGPDFFFWELNSSGRAQIQPKYEGFLLQKELCFCQQQVSLGAEVSLHALGFNWKSHARCKRPLWLQVANKNGRIAAQHFIRVHPNSLPVVLIGKYDAPLNYTCRNSSLRQWSHNARKCPTKGWRGIENNVRSLEMWWGLKKREKQGSGLCQISVQN